jgi:hypothetical protein
VKKRFQSLPFKCNLHRYTAGTAIASVPFDLSTSAAVIYVPSPPFGSGNAYDSFGFQARDAFSSSGEGEVTVNVATSTCAETAPVAGSAGLSATFDGAAACASLGEVDASAALTTSTSSSSTLSARIAFKTGSNAVGLCTLNQVDP